MAEEIKPTNEPVTRADKALALTRRTGAYDVAGTDFAVGLAVGTELRISPRPPEFLTTDNYLERTLAHGLGYDYANSIWRPVPVRAREDGAMAVVVDTELTLAGAVQVASTDNTVANAGFLRINTVANNQNLFVELRSAAAAIDSVLWSNNAVVTTTRGQAVAAGLWGLNIGAGTWSRLSETDVGARQALDVNIAGGGGISTAALTMSAPTFATVGLASGAIIAANAARRYLSLVNDSANIMYLGFGAAAVVGSGIRLNSGGGSLELFGTTLTTQAVNGITTVAGQNIAVQEAT